MDYNSKHVAELFSVLIGYALFYVGRYHYSRYNSLYNLYRYLMEVQEKRKRRLQFLHELYRITYGNENRIVSMRDVGKKYGFDKDTTEEITQYLQEKDFYNFVWPMDR
jgi:sugar phosphate permease